MIFRNSFLCLITIAVAFMVPIQVCAQNDHASVTRAVQEAKKAGVSDETIGRLLSLGYDNGIDAAPMANLVRIIGEVGKENLPQAPFVNKIEEGLAKHVPAASIEQVLNQKKQNYLFTMSVVAGYLKNHNLSQDISARDFVGIAESLNGGLSPADLSSTMERSPGVSLSRIRRAVNLQASLKQAGFDPELSDRIISTGLQYNFFTAQQRGFARAIVTGKRKGIPDDEIAEAALSTIRGWDTVANFCSKIGIPYSEVAQYAY
jgi:hypothetical protein